MPELAYQTSCFEVLSAVCIHKNGHLCILLLHNVKKYIICFTGFFLAVLCELNHPFLLLYTFMSDALYSIFFLKVRLQLDTSPPVFFQI